MKKKITVMAVYAAIFFVCAGYCRNSIEDTEPSRYSAAIETLEYQLGYENTYSTVFSTQDIILRETLREEQQVEETRTVYLTFDDGPSPRTEEILDILKKHDVKATFFVVINKEEYIPYMKMAVEAGHAIGVHSASHKYKEIYRSVDDYLRDFTQCYDYIQVNTGYSPTIFRFPGGSVNNYNASTRKDIVREMGRRGFIYFDWNVESNDSSAGMSADAIYKNVIEGCSGKQRAVIIMHDSVTKNTTVRALDRIITKLKEDGWQFAALDNEVKSVVFRMD
ncbi:MAG: polysaccharide deacetylase [Oscillospiraceae bacterium]|nr:polysaccharide deacetylase [Oscillospiraceae bacterium]